MTVQGVTWEDGRLDGEMNWEGGGQEGGRIGKKEPPAKNYGRNIIGESKSQPGGKVFTEREG